MEGDDPPTVTVLQLRRLQRVLGVTVQKASAKSGERSPRWGHIAQPAIADIKTFDDGQAERPRLLNDTTTHNNLYAAQPEHRRTGFR